MTTKHRGFAPILAIILAVIIIGGGIYLYQNNQEKKEATEIEAQNKINQSMIGLKEKFLAECKTNADQMYHDFSNEQYFKQQSDQAKRDCWDGNFSFNPDSPFQCYSNLQDKDGKQGLLVMLADSAYLDACIKYNLDLVKP